MIDLNGTSYLNMHVIEPSDIFFQSPQTLSVANALTRNSDFDFSVLQSVEEHLCYKFRSEAACLLSSGFLSGIALSDYLLSMPELRGAVLFEEHSHSCSSVISQHLGPQRKVSKDFGHDHYAVVLDSVNPLYGFANDAYYDAPIVRDADIVGIDCSHSVFLWSNHVFPALDQTIIYFGSLGKSAAFPAGFIAGPSAIVEGIKQRATYGSSSPPAQWAGRRLLEKLEEMSAGRDRLRAYVRYIDDLLGRGTNESFFPAYRINNEAKFDAISQDFESNGYRLSRIRYPTSSSPEIVRAVLNASLAWDDVENIARILLHHKSDVVTEYKQRPSFFAFGD